MRISVRGTTGSGKSTLARRLAELHNVKYIELDELWWLPGWKERDREEFRELVIRALDCEDWVVDGNYRAVVEEIVLPRCDMVVWLDYSFGRNLWQLVSRTFRRMRRNEQCCNGNRERFWAQFTWNGLFVWFFRTYWRRRGQCEALMNDPALAHTRRIRLRSPMETAKFLSAIREELLAANDPGSKVSSV